MEAGVPPVITRSSTHPGKRHHALYPVSFSECPRVFLIVAVCFLERAKINATNGNGFDYVFHVFLLFLNTLMIFTCWSRILLNIFFRGSVFHINYYQKNVWCHFLLNPFQMTSSNVAKMEKRRHWKICEKNLQIILLDHVKFHQMFPNLNQENSLSTCRNVWLTCMSLTFHVWLKTVLCTPYYVLFQ